MIEIMDLYSAQGTHLQKVKKTDISPADVCFTSIGLRGSDLSKRYYISVKEPNLLGKKTLFVDISHVFCVTDILQNKQVNNLNWDDISDLLTDQIILGYGSVLPDFEDGKRSLCFAQPLHLPEYFEISYLRTKVPADRNVKFRRWQLLDLGIKKKNKYFKFDLSQSLISVNGLLSLPHYYEEECLMPLGAQFIHANTRDNQPSITLLDFSGLGGIQCVPFSKCTKKIHTGQPNSQQFNMGLNVELFLPEEYSLKNKSVMMVLGHTLFYPDKCRILSDRSIMISPHHLPVGVCLLKQKLASNQFNEYTDALDTDTEVIEYLEAGMYQEDHYGAFFIIINTPKLYINKTHLTQYDASQMHVGPTGTQGYLWDTKSMSIVDQTRLDYQSFADFHAYRSPRMSTLTTFDYYKKHHAVESVHPYYAQYLTNLDGSSMYSIQITRE